MDFNVESLILPDVLCGKHGRGGEPCAHHILGSSNVTMTFPLVEIRKFLSDVLVMLFDVSFGTIHTKSLEVMAMKCSQYMAGYMLRVQNGE